MICSPRPPKPQATLPIPLRVLLVAAPACHGQGSAAPPAWRVAGERRGARSARQSSSGRTAWWATWKDTSTTCPSSMTSSPTPIVLG
ncbi:hypothetical protein CFC21_022309, partial [Triticum aestivum]